MLKNILGAHVSIAGGAASAFLEAEKIGCQVMQIFTKNSNQWLVKELSLSEITKFKQEAKRTKIKVVAHDSYLINLASPNKFLQKKSSEALLIELRRCDLLEIPFLVMHPGSHLGQGEEVGLKLVAENLNKILNNNELKVKILLETTAGQGTNLGHKFEQLAKIRELVDKKAQIGFCLDTCHIFTAGYDLRDKVSYDKMISEFDSILGLKNLIVIHLNDSKKELSSRVDRHEHIGKGFLGKTAFKFILEDERLKHVWKILETPKGDGDVDERADDLLVLQSLLENK